MPIDMDEVRRRRETFKQNSPTNKYSLYTFPVGDTLIYLADMGPNMTTPFMEIYEHGKIGPDEKKVICLRHEANSALFGNAAFVARLAGRKIELDGVCPVCDMLEAGDTAVLPPEYQDEERLNSMKLTQTGYFLIVPWGEITSKGRVDYVAEGRNPLPQLVKLPGKATGQIIDKCCMTENLSDPDAASLLVVGRTGTKMATRYSVDYDAVTLRQPIKVPKPIRFALQQGFGPKGGLDVIDKLAFLFKTADQATAMLYGVESESRQLASEDPPCFGQDYTEGDEACQGCVFAQRCAEAMAPRPAPAAPRPAPARVAVPEPEPEPPQEEEGGPMPEFESPIAAEDSPPEEAASEAAEENSPVEGAGEQGGLPFETEPEPSAEEVAPEPVAPAAAPARVKRPIAVDPLEAAVRGRRRL